MLDIHDLELSDKNSSIGWPDGKEGCYFIEFSNGLYGTSELKYFVRLSNAKPILKCTQEFVKTIIKALNINQPLPKDIIIRCKPCNVYNWQAERRIFINPCNFQLKKQ